jgi:ANTAR domain
MDPTVEEPAPTVRALLPGDVVRSPSGDPVALVVRTRRGWTVLGSDPVGGCPDAADAVAGDAGDLTLVEAMSLADLVAGERGITPEPDREARRAARENGGSPAQPDQPDQPADRRDVEVAGLRRTVGQLEHALAARVSIDRAIGVLAERHGTTPREAFEELRRHARAQGRAAQELAAEVLEAMPARTATTGQCCVHTHTAHTPPPALEPRPAGGGPAPRRVQRNPRRPSGGDTVPGAPS